MPHRLILILLLIGVTGQVSARNHDAAASEVFSSNIGTTVSLDGTYATVFRIAGVEYSGQIEFSTQGDGLTTGRLKLRSPIAMSGEVNVKITGTALRFEMSYVRETDGCTGEGSGSGRLLRDGREVTGDVEIIDCASRPRTGSFSWSRE